MGCIRWASLLGFLPLALTASMRNSSLKAYISTATDYNTECKTCPHSLCPNTYAYTYYETLNVTCWTRGTKIMDDNLWLKSEAGCYVTQYDLREYQGDYTTDLKYCGRDSEDEQLTTEDATLQYKTECRICVDSMDCYTVAYLPEETDLTLTCWTNNDTMQILDNPYWYKTTNNCYVAEVGLYSKPDITYLDNCGPQTFLEYEWHNNENGTSEIDKRATPRAPVGPHANYLINVTVGEDYAKCRSCPRDDCDIQTRYPFNSHVILQCLEPPVAQNNWTWWSETTDFCYVKDSDFWESPEGDNYAFPLCSYFNNGSSNKKRGVTIWKQLMRWIKSS